MSKQITGFVAWIRTFLDDVYAPKGSGGSITLNDVYPVGSIYMSVNNASPQTLFGGTWVQLQDTFLYATSTSADANSTTATGGSADAVVVEHNHSQNPHNHGAGTGKEFIVADSGTNFALYAKHGLPTTSGSYCTMYASSQGAVTEPATTADATAVNIKNGVDGTGKNMPPFMKVFMWKRTG